MTDKLLLNCYNERIDIHGQNNILWYSKWIRVQTEPYCFTSAVCVCLLKRALETRYRQRYNLCASFSMYCSIWQSTVCVFYNKISHWSKTIFVRPRIIQFSHNCTRDLYFYAIHDKLMRINEFFLIWRPWAYNHEI